MKTLPLPGLPTTNEQLVESYGDILQSMFGYDVIVLRNYDTADNHGLFKDNLLNKLIEDGIINIANYTRGSTGGIETTFELTALGFVTKAMSIQQDIHKKILAGAAHYRRDIDLSDDDTLQNDSLTGKTAVSGKTPAASVPPKAASPQEVLGAKTPVSPLSAPVLQESMLTGADDNDDLASKSAGTQGEASIVKPNGDSGPHAFLVGDEQSTAGSNDTIDTVDESVPLENKLGQNGKGSDEFQIPHFLQRARSESSGD